MFTFEIINYGSDSQTGVHRDPLVVRKTNMANSEKEKIK